MSRILFLSHEKLVIKFTMSLRYSLVLEVLPTQFLVASTATDEYGATRNQLRSPVITLLGIKGRSELTSFCFCFAGPGF